MQQLVFFIQKYKFFLFFLLLEGIAFFLIVNNHTFHKSKFVSSTNFITGNLYEKTSNLTEYLNLNDRNKELVLENLQLKNDLENLKSLLDTTIYISVVDSTKYNQKYIYTAAKTIKNEYHKNSNYITINKGEKDGISFEMAVVNSKGIIGITDLSNNNYSRVQSIININSKINARLKNNTYFGTLEWNGNDYNIVQLNDIPRQIIVKRGDTIITGGKSAIFPEGILIGTVDKINTTTNSLDVKLFNDMANIGPLYVIKNLEKLDLKSLNE
ncbi:rod shape-determining protein MreC [Lutibacter sp. Hel_I_33_5]|uniref:rod shape-determining protein MreC n=1 Tax=Lutibacter sp. Hel_I_33_5 TaxID=1566289 RepID=UPI0011A920A3|nr:rod shape-determining protein MreC [Lutibacter sp. Hel_I_33_5]TVZ56743.1 rod shape-determining protein MreC [Lutibacter sp. Hel_I_33_5]